ncbi:MAG: hypothetical protein ABID54_14590, partial [Pseudomonadota bacterium]
PTITEILVTVGIWATGLLIYSIILKVAIPIETGEFRLENNRNRHFSERLEGRGRYLVSRQ